MQSILMELGAEIRSSEVHLVRAEGLPAAARRKYGELALDSLNAAARSIERVRGIIERELYDLENQS